MDSFPLGRFSVARVGLGAIQLPGPGAFGPPRDRDAALAVLRRAVELGVNHIDTAQFYGPNVSNDLIREAYDRVPADEPNPEQIYHDSRLGPDLQAALDSLPPEFRAAVVLCDIEGLSYEEIGATLGIKLGTVRSRIHRGRQALRDYLAAHSKHGADAPHAESA